MSKKKLVNEEENNLLDDINDLENDDSGTGEEGDPKLDGDEGDATPSGEVEADSAEGDGEVEPEVVDSRNVVDLFQDNDIDAFKEKIHQQVVSAVKDAINPPAAEEVADDDMVDVATAGEE